MKPRVTLLLGDRNGIGPELIARLLADPATAEAATLEVLGDPEVLAKGAKDAGVWFDDAANAFTVTPYRPVEGIRTTPGQVSGDAGRECLALLSHASKRVVAGESDGVVFAPLNKEAMHKGGLEHEDEMRFIAAELDYTGAFGELNVLDRLWTTRVTSHVPLKDVAAHITEDAVLESIRFAEATLKAARYERPRIAVAALNPHAGDGGNFGREEIEVIRPAVERARAEQIAADGPYPSDTVFVRAFRGDYDAVVTMYHDQGQIALKVVGLGRGVTVLGGLPVPIATCGHGTGYDIVGQGVARTESMVNAFRICCDMASSRRGAA